MLEKNIVAAIMRYLKGLSNCFSWKTHGGTYGRSGLPDIICCIGGKFYAFEVKTVTGKATKLQLATINKIIKSGGVAAIVRSVDEVKYIIGKLEGNIV